MYASGRCGRHGGATVAETSARGAWEAPTGYGLAES